MNYQLIIGIIIIISGLFIVLTAPTNNYYRVYYKNNTNAGIFVCATNYNEVITPKFLIEKECDFTIFDVKFIEKLSRREFMLLTDKYK